MGDEFILNYYKKQAETCGDSWNSTMQDEIIRDKEIEVITTAIDNLELPCLVAFDPKTCIVVNQSLLIPSILDLGCGNGYTVERVAAQFPEFKFTASDFCEDMLKIASARKLSNVQVSKEDARHLSFPNYTFDLIYTERCLINILDWEEQKKALSEIIRTLKVGGHYVMIECFMDGHQNYNKARKEFGLDEIPLPPPNRFFDKELVMQELKTKGVVLSANPSQIWRCPNFLSSHYFMARVIHPLLCKEPIRNSEFVKFFSTLPPSGNYSPIQVLVFKKW